jgi:hypothetical protein
MIQAFRREESQFETARFHLSGWKASSSSAVSDIDSDQVC